MEVLEELESSCLGNKLKKWADKWGYTVETKGGIIAPDYDHFIVTSNHSIQEVFADKAPILIDALLARFEVHEYRHSPLGVVITKSARKTFSNYIPPVKPTDGMEMIIQQRKK